MVARKDSIQDPKPVRYNERKEQRKNLKAVNTMWNYAELPDGTCIAYSNLRDDGTIRISVERPREGGFDSAHCLMPAYRWMDVDGFSDAELADLKEFLRDNAPLIFELAQAPYDERLTA